MECFELADSHRLSRNVCTVLIFLYLANIAHLWRPFAIKVHSPNVMSPSPDILDSNFTIDETSKITFYLNIKRDQANAFLHVTYVFADKDGNYNLVYANKTVDLCAFLTNRKIDIVMRIVMAVSERFGQLPTHCPIKKKLYYVTNMRISAENLPPVMPEAKGILSFTWMVKVNGGFKTLLGLNASFALENIFKSTEKHITQMKL